MRGQACASQSGEQPNGWVGSRTMWQLGIPGVESGEEGLLLRSAVVRSTWAQVIAVASAGGTGGREGCGADAGQGTGGVPYQTPWYLPERHLPEADVHTKYLMSG